MLTRREMLKKTAQAGAVLSLHGGVLRTIAGEPVGTLVNDVQSQLNPTRVRRVESPRSIGEIQNLIRKARDEDMNISIAGGRHAMGGQQFGRDTLLFDMRSMDII